MSYIPSLLIEIHRFLEVHANYLKPNDIYILTYTLKYSCKSQTTQNHNIDTLTTRWRLLAKTKIRTTSFHFKRNKEYMNPVLPFISKQFNKYWHSTILTFATCPKVPSRATMLSTGWYKQINYSWNLTEISKIHSPSEFPQKWVPSSGAMIYFWRTAFCCSLTIFYK